MTRKAALYVDGFNFYYGVRNHYKAEQKARGYSLSGLCWCDFRALAERHFVRPGHALGPIRYFTAPVTEEVEMTSEEHSRYDLWLKAARTIAGLEVVQGFYKRKGSGRAEKESDVNLAVELLLDGMAGVYDHAIVLSGDADQIPAILAAALRLPQPRCVTALLPPSQNLDDWKKHYCKLASQVKERGGLRHRQALNQVQVAVLDEGIMANSLLRYDLGAVHAPEYWRLPGHFLGAHCRAEHRPDLRG
ncbi:MAG: NYN domain-containing protein [Acidobacteria bacterium]|nr:NYN domain-containing protein [Acidobacteriota bacterium]